MLEDCRKPEDFLSASPLLRRSSSFSEGPDGPRHGSTLPGLRTGTRAVLTHAQTVLEHSLTSPPGARSWHVLISSCAGRGVQASPGPWDPVPGTIA